MPLLMRALVFLGLMAGSQWAPAASDTEPFVCSNCARWNAPEQPFLLAPNTWYVGTQGLSSVLINTGDGLLLIDGGLPQSAASIATHIQQLGFDLRKVRWILNSHAHFDHAGGIAALARWTGAEVIASERGAEALRVGDVSTDDPQAGYRPFNRFPPAVNARAVADGQSLTFGNLTITPHYTAGHAPGSTSWAWPACDANGACAQVVYADSLTAVSSPDYRFDEHLDYVASFRSSIERVRELPCDVLISAHPEFADVFTRRDSGTLIDDGACRRYASTAKEALEKRIASERVEHD